MVAEGPSEKLVGIWISVWGFLAVAMGSIATGFFFVTGGIAVIHWFKKTNNRDAGILPGPKADVVTFALVVYVLFFLAVAVTAFMGENPKSAAMFVGSYLHWLFIFVMVEHLVRFAPDTNLLAKFVMGCRRGVIVAFGIGLVEFAITGQRASGFSGNPLVYAELSFAAGALSLLRFEEDTDFEKIVSVVAVLAALGTNLLAASRGISLLTLPLVIILGTYLLMKSRIDIRKLIVAILVLVSFAAAAIVIFQNRFNVEQQQQILVNVPSIASIKDPSLRERYALLVTGWQVFKMNPVTGVGIQNTVSAASAQSESVLGTAVKFGKTHLHNDYLNHLVGGGIGLGVLFVIILLSPVMIASRLKSGRDRLEVVFFAIILSYVFMGIAAFNLVFRHDLTQTFFVTALIMLIATIRQKNAQP